MNGFEALGNDYRRVIVFVRHDLCGRLFVVSILTKATLHGLLSNTGDRPCRRASSAVAQERSSSCLARWLLCFLAASFAWLVGAG